MRADQFEKKARQLRAALEGTTARLGQHFANLAARGSAAAYLRSLLSGVERKNSWQLAEAAGFDTPYRFQHLLGRGAWDADALRDEQLGVVLAGLARTMRSSPSMRLASSSKVKRAWVWPGSTAERVARSTTAKWAYSCPGRRARATR